MVWPLTKSCTRFKMPALVKSLLITKATTTFKWILHFQFAKKLFSVPAWLCPCTLSPCTLSQLHKYMVWWVWCGETQVASTDHWPQPYWNDLESWLWSRSSHLTSVSNLTNVVLADWVQIPADKIQPCGKPPKKFRLLYPPGGVILMPILLEWDIQPTSS